MTHTETRRKAERAADARTRAEKREHLAEALRAIAEALNENARNPCRDGLRGCMRKQEELPPRSVQASMQKRGVSRAMFWDLDPEHMCEPCAAHWYASAAHARLAGAARVDWITSARADRDAQIERHGGPGLPTKLSVVDVLARVLPLAEAYLKGAPSHPDNALLETARCAVLTGRIA